MVEFARSADASAAVALRRTVLAEREFFITEPQEFDGSVPEALAMIRELRRATNGAYFVARRDEGLLGLLTVQGGLLRRMRHAGKLEIMVAPEARGQGIGTGLMTACIEWAEANPAIHKLGLSVFATNAPAMKLYERFGFREEGRREREYRMEDGSYRDDVLMYRFVGPNTP